MNRDICVLKRKHLARAALLGELKSQESVSMFLFWRWDTFDRLIFGYRNCSCLGYFPILFVAYLVVILVACIIYYFESRDGGAACHAWTRMATARIQCVHPWWEETRGRRPPRL